MAGVEVVYEAAKAQRAGHPIITLAQCEHTDAISKNRRTGRKNRQRSLYERENTAISKITLNNSTGSLPMGDVGIVNDRCSHFQRGG